jgi:hypothetical protein
MEVKLISAAWCKRCHELKPDVIATCALIGATVTVVDYDELEEDDPLKESIKALPSLLFRRAVDCDWQMYEANAFDEWKRVATAAAVAAAITHTDF